MSAELVVMHDGLGRRVVIYGDLDSTDALASCGITRHFAVRLARQYQTERDRILRDPLSVIADHWNNETGMDSKLEYPRNSNELHDALVSLHVLPELIKWYMSRPLDGASLSKHTRSIDIAIMFLSGDAPRKLKNGTLWS